MKKLIRTSTVALSLDLLLKGQLQYLSKHFHVIAVSGYDEHLEQVKKREGVIVHNLPMKRPISLVQDLIALLRLYFYFRAEKPHIVHSITPKAGLLSMTAAKLAGVPIRMHTFTGLIFPTRRGALQKVLIFMDKWLCKMATDVYPEGHGVRQDLIKFAITKKPLHIIANGNINGIDLAYFSPDSHAIEDKLKLRANLGIGSTDFIFIFIGRLVPDKGIDELVSAFKEVGKVYSQARLLLVGPLEAALAPLKTVTLLEIKENSQIISVGYQADVRQFLAIADALVFPSYREGFPNVVLQAGAMGLPAIVTDINGSNEIIEDRVNGLIIKPASKDALLQAMQLLLSNQALYIKLAAAARPMIANRFDQKMVWESLLSEYKRLESLRVSNV